MSDKSYKIELKDMEFFAHHGCFKEEQIIGNKFIVNISVEGDFSKAEKSDDISDALNYQIIYNIVSEQMGITSNLLENVAGRIVDKIVEAFDIERVELRIDKINPPLGGKLCSSSVTICYPKNNIK